MKRQTILLLFAVIVSLLPMTAHSNFLKDVSNAYLPGEVRTIMVGEGEAPIIEIGAKTPLPLGTAIVLTEPFPSSLTLSQGNSLADLLAEKGWNVVISPFHLPVTPSEPINEDTIPGSSNEGDSAPSSQPNEIHPRSNQLTQYLSFETTVTALTLQLSALYNYLQDRGGYRMVIAQGMLATTFLSATEQQPALDPDTFIAISPFWPEESTNNLVIETMAQANYPVLDVSLNNFNDWESNTTLKRKIRAKNALKLHYRQINIPNNSLTFSIKDIHKPPQIQMVANSAIGWTRHLGW